MATQNNLYFEDKDTSMQEKKQIIMKKTHSAKTRFLFVDYSPVLFFACSDIFIAYSGKLFAYSNFLFAYAIYKHGPCLYKRAPCL
jgi:hypothetical protein